MSKIMMAAAFGAGYVLGAKAGRERYEQLSAKAQELWQHPTVQEKAGQVKEKAGRAQEQARGALSEDQGGSAAGGDDRGADEDSVLAGGTHQDPRG
ncbi:YtxH domain-containing protein [Serinicoccus sediminis]|uniref:YtxH domain-containing protein n=1 Tax=Serinicoccus sediminis TaxID=2306021 RepID=UPI00192D90C4|nr:YtxH domain-containing protein [Serinicoccus sediminis]